MADSNVNTIVLTKEAYDRLKNENMRCRLLLENILKYITFVDENSNDLKLDDQRILRAIELCYTDSYNQKVSQLKRKRTIERERTLAREV